MTDEKKLKLAMNKVDRLTEQLDAAEREGDEDLYNDLEKQLEQAQRKVERLKDGK